MSSIKALVFDIGTVLIQLDFGQIMQLRDFNTTDLGGALQKMDEWQSYDLFERGQIDENVFFTGIESTLKTQIERTALINIWNSVLKETVPGVPELLSQLSKTIPIYALTNSNPTHIAFVQKHYPWMQYFRKVFTSYELNARKPEAKIYKRVSELIETPAANILFIDDRMENVLGARAAGWKAELCANGSSAINEILRKYTLLAAA